MRRKKMSRRASRRAFSRGAKRVNSKNNRNPNAMRGGIRL